jgi:ribosomal protein S18 acetylase RimI-like enzyme
MPMHTVTIDIRTAKPDDAPGLAEAHAEAWRGAYRGVIPPIVLERMIARRGAPYWRSLARRAGSAVRVLVFDEVVAGYATIGASRSGPAPLTGEIYELYLRPPYQGVGLGRRLMRESRRVLTDAGYRGLLIWALSDNEPACAFYERMGGRIVAERRERIGSQSLKKVAYHWEERA